MRRKGPIVRVERVFEIILVDVGVLGLLGNEDHFELRRRSLSLPEC